MRRGEVLGLRWGDLDLEAGRVSVRQALVSVAYEVQISDVKTGTGRRTIDIDDGHRRRAEGVAHRRGPRRRGGIDPGRRRSGLRQARRHRGSTRTSFSQIFDRTVAKLDVPAISLHDLRHTHATLLLKAGVPVKVVSERLGHANVAFTMSVYQHVLPGMQAEAAAMFSELLSRTSRTAARRGVSGAHE